MSPKVVAELGCAACLKGETICIPGLANRLLTGGAQLLPRKLVRALGGMVNVRDWGRHRERALQPRRVRQSRQAMTSVQANGITIEYAETGPRDAPVILLIMGLGMQLIAWPQSFCDGLAARGFRVIRFDNRDAGHSTPMPAGSLAIAAMMAGAVFGLPVRPPYTLTDMARDALGLIDALGIGRAHVVGASMGGMIAQILAIEHPERVKSLTSIMSTTGNRRLPGPNAKVLRALLRPRPRNKAAAVRRGMQLFRLIGGSGYPPTEAELRDKVERAVHRSYRPGGVLRQLLAIHAAPSRVRGASARARANPRSAWLRRSARADGGGRGHRRQHPRRALAHHPRHGALSARSAGSASRR